MQKTNEAALWLGRLQQWHEPSIADEQDEQDDTMEQVGSYQRHKYEYRLASQVNKANRWFQIRANEVCSTVINSHGCEYT